MTTETCCIKLDCPDCNICVGELLLTTDGVKDKWHIEGAFVLADFAQDNSIQTPAYARQPDEVLNLLSPNCGCGTRLVLRESE